MIIFFICYKVEFDKIKVQVDIVQYFIQLIRNFVVIIQFIFNGEIIDVNDLFCSVVGYLLNQFQGQYYWMFCLFSYVKSQDYVKFW